MKKVLIGLGIAFGALMLLGVVGLFAAGMWAKKSLGGMTDNLEAISSNSERAAALNDRFDYDSAEGERVVALKDDRLAIWMQVGQKTQEKFEAWTKTLEQQDAANGSQEGVKGLQDAFAKAKAGTQMVTELQQATLDALESAGMAPGEYRDITHTVMKGLAFQMTEQMQTALADNLKRLEASREESKAALADPDLPEAQRAMHEQMVTSMEQSLVQLKEQLKSAEEDPDRELLKANAALIEAHKEQVQELTASAISAGMLGVGIQ